LFGTNAFVKTGSADFQAFKFNATGVVVGDITVNQNNPGRLWPRRPGLSTGTAQGTSFSGSLAPPASLGRVTRSLPTSSSTLPTRRLLT
jgi:hypothetical protein